MRRIFVLIVAFISVLGMTSSYAVAGELFPTRRPSFRYHVRSSGNAVPSSFRRGNRRNVQRARMSTSVASRMNPVSRGHRGVRVNRYEERRLSYVKAEHKYQKKLYNQALKLRKKQHKARLKEQAHKKKVYAQRQKKLLRKQRAEQKRRERQLARENTQKKSTSPTKIVGKQKDSGKIRLATPKSKTGGFWQRLKKLLFGKS